MAPAFLGLAAALFWHASAAIVARQRKPGAVVQPEIVVPGEWLTDPAEHFLFLPLTVPADVPLSQCKVMSNGESLLVVVTERPEEEPETNALRKYKLVMEAIKKEAVHDEGILQAKLQTWLETEDDDEVKVHIEAALNSLKNVKQAKQADAHKTISVSLGVPHPAAAASSLLELDAVPNASKAVVVAPTSPSHALLRGTTQHDHVHHHHHARVIKESFAVEVPYPVPTERIVMLRTRPTTLMVAMPLVRKSLEAKGISTGGKPFLRVPVFSDAGRWIGGPRADLGAVAAGLNVAAVVAQVGFQPLSDD